MTKQRSLEARVDLHIRVPQCRMTAVAKCAGEGRMGGWVDAGPNGRP